MNCGKCPCGVLVGFKRDGDGVEILAEPGCLSQEQCDKTQVAIKASVSAFTKLIDADIMKVFAERMD